MDGIFSSVMFKWTTHSSAKNLKSSSRMCSRWRFPWFRLLLRGGVFRGGFPIIFPIKPLDSLHKNRMDTEIPGYAWDKKPEKFRLLFEGYILLVKIRWLYQHSRDSWNKVTPNLLLSKKSSQDRRFLIFPTRIGWHDEMLNHLYGTCLVFGTPSSTQNLTKNPLQSEAFEQQKKPWST